MRGNHCKDLSVTGDFVLVVENLWPLGCILEVKVNPNKRDGHVRRVTLKERPFDKLILLETS